MGFGSQIKISRDVKSQLTLCGELGFALPITPDTEINIYFDSSGSMDTTLAPLQTMRDTLLKDVLIGFYNDDETLYEQKVNVVNFGTERTFDVLNNGDPNTFPVRNIVFQDESAGTYLPDQDNTALPPPNGQYQNDISALRNNLINNWEPGKYRGITFQVETSPDGDGGLGFPLGAVSLFRTLIKACEEGTDGYEVPNGLSDRDEFVFNYNVVPASTPEYYADLILGSL